MDDFSGVTQALIKNGIPAIVAMQFSMPVDSANLFMKAFYFSLANKQAIDEAVTSGRLALFTSSESATPRDWGIPVLYLQAESSIMAKSGKRSSVAMQGTEVEVTNNLDYVSSVRCANLVGRGKDMIRVAEALREPGVRRRFVTVTGLGGIGKSSLAIESAYWHLERKYFPKGVFWLNAEGLSLEIILDKMAGLLGIKALDTLDTDSKIASLCSIHRNNEIFFIIDNADSLRNDTDFRHFLESLSSTPRGKLLLTSRQPIDVDGEKSVDLDTINLTSAIKLFLYIWGIDKPEEEQIKQVAAICGRGMLEGHPLAIFIAASVARKEMNPDLKSLTKRMSERMIETLSDRSTSQEEVSVEASLRLSWDALEEMGKSLLSRVSVFRIPFSDEAIAAIAEDLGDWHPVMVELLQHRLVMRIDSHYYLHPVVQSFAARELKSPEKVHLMAGMFLIDSTYLEEHLEGIDHLEIAGEFDRLIAGVRSVYNQLVRIGYWDLASSKLKQGLKAARELGDKKSEMIMLGELGSTYDLLGLIQESIECCEQSLAISREIGDREGEGNALINLGNANLHLSRFNTAIEYQKQALAIFREIENRIGERGALGNLGTLYRNIGKFITAIEYQEQSLALSKKIGDRLGESKALGELGVAYCKLDDLSKGKEFLEKSLAISREIGDRQSEATTLGNLGNIHQTLDDFSKAIECQEQALVISRKIGDRYGERNALGNFGNIYFFLGNVSKALESWEQSLAISREVGDRQNESKGLENLGTIYRKLGKISEAIEYREQSLAISREIGDREGEGYILRILGIDYIEMGDDKIGLMYLIKARVVFKDIGSQDIEFIEKCIDELRKKLGDEKYKKLEAQVRSHLAEGT